MTDKKAVWLVSQMLDSTQTDHIDKVTKWEAKSFIRVIQAKVRKIIKENRTA